MAGFRALAAQVRDPGREVSQRRRALRKCLERFAPYGHQATWHHLCERAGFDPRERAPDPALLIAALEELEEARAVWLSHEREFARRRKAQKHDGIRQPTAPDDWHTHTWGGRALLTLDDPGQVPRVRLAVVLHRMIATMEGGARGPTSRVVRQVAFAH